MKFLIVLFSVFWIFGISFLTAQPTHCSLDDFLADLAGEEAKQVALRNAFDSKPELVDAWRKMFDLGDAIPDAIKRNPDILSKTQNWSDDLYAKLATVKDRNPRFFDNPLGKDIQKNPEILDYFEGGASIINNKSGNLKAVELDMYALDRSRTGSSTIFESGTTSYIKNPTSTNVDDLIVNPSGTIKGKKQLNPNATSNELLNGKEYMYVIDETGNIHIGTRNRSQFGNMPGDLPHPTLIGGTNPNIMSAGIIEFRGGKIYKVDNASGHFKPDQSLFNQAESIFRDKFPANSFADYSDQSLTIFESIR